MSSRVQRIVRYRLWPFSILLLVLVLGALHPALARSKPDLPPRLRLGDEVVPTHYDLTLRIDPAQDGFKGEVHIALEVKKATRTIWFNSTALELVSGQVESGHLQVPGALVKGNEDFAGYRLDKPLSPGRVTLSVAFRGRFAKTSTRGLFKQEDGGHWYVFSQFEAIDARRAFPCFDQPGFKTPWRLTLKIPTGLEAFSNTPRSNAKESPDGMTTVRFAETKPLPTYLVALGVGPFDVVSAGAAGRQRTPLRIIALAGKGSEGDYAKQALPGILEHLESYYGVPYPYAKLDSMTIPQTVAFGAMENAGLITYAEGYLLASRSEDTVSFRRRSTSVMAHEMAHQWTGDLVTMKWWNDIWLNESFATWMSSKMVQEIHPEWKVDVSRIESRSRAMNSDTLVSARKIRQPVESKADIANAFDGISYGKGAAVIAMFESWMGAKQFQQGVHAYLLKHRFGNATAGDFLAALESAGGAGIVDSFSTFLDQAGVPVVKVALVCRSGEPPSVNLSQQRLLPLGSPKSTKQIWQIPICMRFPGGNGVERLCRLMKGSQESLRLPGIESCPAWLLANDGEVGYYRTQYQGDLLKDLLADGAKQLSEGERVGVIGDTAALARADAIPMSTALALVPEFASSPSRHVVQAVADIAHGVGERLVNDETRGQYRRFILKSFGARAEGLGWKDKSGEGDEIRLLRRTLVPMVAEDGEDPGLERAARELAVRWLKDHSVVDSDMAGPLLSVAARHGDKALFASFLAAVERESSRRDRQRLFAALASFRDPALHQRALSLLTDTRFDPRETFRLFGYSMGDPASRAATWKFFKRNFTTITRRMPHEMGPYLPYVVSGFCDETHAREAKDFFAGKVHDFPGMERTLAQALERIHQCEAERKAQGKSVARFLAMY